MKKKVLYGFAMALIASVSMGTLQSCKDDLSDFKHQYNYDQTGLLKRVSDLEDAVKKCKEDCALKLAELDRRITTNEGNIEDIQAALAELPNTLSKYVTYERLEEILNELKEDYYTKDEVYKKSEVYSQEEMNQKIGEINQKIADDIAKAEADIKLVTDDLAKQLGDLNETVDGLNKTVEDLGEAVDTNKTDIAGIKEKLETYDQTLREINDKLMLLEPKVEGLVQDVEGLKGQIEDLNGYIEEAFLAIEQTQEFMTQLRNELLDTIDEKFNELTNRLDNLITGIELQGAISPVFGNLNTPLGIQSNILFNWYGYNDVEAFDFPSASADYNYYEAAPVLTADELATLAPEYKNVKKGVLGDVKLGKFYMTINPAGHLFNEEGFKLESTAENQFPATLTVKKSTDELTFGYTRSVVEGNGFYEAEVEVKEADIDAAKMEIQDGLKSTVEDALKDPSKRTAIGLLKGVYSQFNGTLPAYAVRYSWTNEGKDYSVASNYGIAATTAKPLSYAFLYGKGSDKKVPTYGHINNFIERFKEKLSNNLTFTFDNNLKVDGKEISWRRVDNFREAGDHIEATIVGLTVDGKVYPDFTVNCGSEPENVSNMITAGIIDKIWGANVTDAIKTEAYAKITVTLLEMQKQIAEVINEINGTVDKAVDDAFNQVESYAKHVNRIIDLYNKVANKINGFLKNPNHYLQVAMFYNQADSKMGLLSNTLKSPTVFTRGNGNVGLYASSYTGELVCPAYMKYVACTNVYDAETKQPVAGEAAAVNAAAKNFNTVMTGNTIRYSVPASALKDGRIYEIVYQGVDYSGRTSTQKFYIQVK